MSKEKQTSGTGFFVSLLSVAFIVLKLCNVITWSWWWVLSPLWISACFSVVVFLVVVGIKTKENLKKEKIKEKTLWEKRREEILSKQKVDSN